MKCHPMRLAKISMIMLTLISATGLSGQVTVLTNITIMREPART